MYFFSFTIDKCTTLLPGKNGGEAMLNDLVINIFAGNHPPVNTIKAIVSGGFIAPHLWPMFDNSHKSDGHSTPDGTYYEQYNVVGEIVPILTRYEAGSDFPTHRILSWTKDDGTFK